MSDKNFQDGKPYTDETLSQPTPVGDSKAGWLDEEIKRMEAEKYDGIKGRPPEWMPEPLKKEFIAVRESLLRWFGSSPSMPICPHLQ